MAAQHDGLALGDPLAHESVELSARRRRRGALPQLLAEDRRLLDVEPRRLGEGPDRIQASDRGTADDDLRVPGAKRADDRRCLTLAAGGEAPRGVAAVTDLLLGLRVAERDDREGAVVLPVDQVGETTEQLGVARIGHLLAGLRDRHPLDLVDLVARPEAPAAQLAASHL